MIKSRIDAEAAPNISSDVTYAAVAALFGIPETELNYEWQFLRRLPMDLSTSETGVVPVLASKILLVPIGTAEVERSFILHHELLYFAI